MVNMGLFSSDAEEKEVIKKIRPTIIKTQNIAKELMDIATKNNVNVSTLDFDILEVETHTRVNKEKEEVAWEEITVQEIKELDDATTILNENFQIQQTYEIEVFTKNEKNKFKDFHAVIGANASKCKVYLSVKAGSKIEADSKFDEEFLNFINKNKARAGILINIFDEMLYSTVSKISAVGKVNGNLSYDKNETILIADSHEPMPTTDDALIMHYEKADDTGNNAQIDYADRGFIKSVLEGDLLIEYIKPKKGKVGRNCRGEFMQPSEPQVSHAPTFNIDETIEMVDNPDNIEYRAKEAGYISLEGSTYVIKSEMDVDTIDFKTTGNISSGKDSEVTLSVKENDAQKDAIGNGMEVEVSEIDISGNIGPNAKVIARRATVEGQTHASSEIRADDLTINVHKGLAIGNEITIARLENGIVKGEKITVTQALGGNIKAKIVKIDICASHVNVTASKLIEIKKLQGSENIFTIDPLSQKDTKYGFGQNKDEITDLQSSVNEIQQDIVKYSKIVKDNTGSFNEIKKRLMHYKKNGIQMPSSFVLKYKQFNKAQEHLETIKKEHKAKIDKLQLLTTKTASFQDNIFDAKIINKDRWVGHNELMFRLVDPPIELSFKPPAGSKDKIFAIVETDDGIYEIQAVQE
jgi:hypothetical protein